MTDIPSEIMKAANAVPVRFTTDSGYCELDIASLRSEIARAIMAERSRCAFIADAEAETRGMLVNALNLDFDHGAERAAEMIADAIRKGA